MAIRHFGNDNKTFSQASCENDAGPVLPHPADSDAATINENTDDLESTPVEASHSIPKGTRQTANIPQFSQYISYLRPDDIRGLLDVQSPAPRMIHIRNASMNDFLSDVSSTRTTIFSKQASIITKSSQSSLSVKSSKYSQLIDALNLSTGKSNGRDDESTQTSTLRTFSLSNDRVASNGISKIQENTESARSAAVTRDDTLLEFGTANVIGTTIEHREPLCRTEPTNTRPHRIDNPSPSGHGRFNAECISTRSNSECHDTEFGDATTDDYPYDNNKKPHYHRKWYNKLSRTTAEVPGKVQELAKAAKKFGLTLRAFMR